MTEIAATTNLTPQEQRARLLKLLAQKEQETKLAPLSFSQERFWFQEQLSPGSLSSLSLTTRIRGDLNVPILEQSLSEIVRRHESLRTAIVLEHGQPMQVIKPAAPLHVPIITLEHFPAAVREAEARQICAIELKRPFDIARGPLFRATLLRLDATDHVLVLITQHLISDAWSLSILIQELSVLYEAYLKGQPSPLAPLPWQYADFAQWQREKMGGETLERELAYWIKQIGDSPPLNMPTDRQHALTQTTSGAREPTTIPLKLSEQLKALAQQQGCTLFMVLLTGLQVLLQRYTGQDDISVYTFVANRTVNTVEKLIGLFLNTLALRTQFGPNPTFRQVLQQVRQVTLDAYDHQTVPFQKLSEALQAQGDRKRAPSFQVVLLLQNVPYPTINLSDLKCERFVREMDFQVGMGMMLSLVETEAGLSGWIEYPTELFEAATIRRLLEHYQTLLTAAVANPDQPIAELPLLSATEQQYLLTEWNDTRAEFPVESCLPELFEEQVNRTPDAVAVVFEQQHLTYRELNRRANQLAHQLRQRGVGPETIVGLCLERTPEMIVSLLGILKAGGAYVPLDPTSPTQRLATILQDTQVQLLISQSSLVSILPALEAPVLLIDREWEVVAQHDSGNPAHTAKPSNLAYVIYTSGSTGQPKGVMIPQQALVQYATAAVQHFGLTPQDGVLQFASISFDAAAEEIYPCLLSGARLILRTDRMLDSIETFLQTCAAERITVLDLPTAYWHTLVAQGGTALSDFPPNVRLIILGGEAALAEKIMTWFEQAPQHIRLVNTYGPTETTIVATKGDLTPDTGEIVPLGRPIANTQVYILDSHLRPVPIGVPGELYIGGVDLARGYLHRPELTAAVFLPDPHGEAPGARLYKTGDLVRYLPDGQLQFLGRVDQQVKVRGFRIELGEIETALNRHPAIQQSVVVMREESTGDKRLVAYLVSADSQQVSTSDLRQFLQDTLPDYMIPAAFVSLDALPLTPSGKVDRRALPAPEADLSQEEYAPPETPVEEKLTEIWSHVLNVDPISIHANFFDLGGHSLLATQVIYRINKALQTKLAVRDLFLEPTIARLGLLIEERLIEELEREGTE